MRPSVILAAALAALGAACSLSTPAPPTSVMASAALEPLVDAHFAIINELDAARRLERMPAVYTNGIVFHDPGPPAVGHRSVSAAYEALHQRFPGAVFRHDAVLERDGLLRVGWVLDRGGASLHHGEDIMRLESGRIAELWVFIQPESSVPTDSRSK